MWLVTAVACSICWAGSGAKTQIAFLNSVATSIFDAGSQATTRTLPALIRKHAFSTTDSVSPELDSLLGEIDEKMKPLKISLLSQDRCSEMTNTLAVGDTSNGANGHLLFHTGMVSVGGVTGWPDGIRKLRLSLLSFLATQDLRSAEVHFWADVGLEDPVLGEALRPILADKRYASHVKVHKFDAGREFTAAFPEDPETAKLFMELHDKETMLPSRSDLQRSVLLNNYGGLWFDTDVLLVSDLTAVAKEDWAYLGQDDFINNALLSVSKPHSAFIKAYLVTIAALSIRSAANTDTFKYGPNSLKRVFMTPQTSGTFHVLPTCFFDGGWWGVQSSTTWDDFFSSVANEDQVAYIAPVPGKPYRTLAYHWHNRWEKPIVSGSLADRAEKIYVDKLQLSV